MAAATAAPPIPLQTLTTTSAPSGAPSPAAHALSNTVTPPVTSPTGCTPPASPTRVSNSESTGLALQNTPSLPPPPYRLQSHLIQIPPHLVPAVSATAPPVRGSVWNRTWPGNLIALFGLLFCIILIPDTIWAARASFVQTCAGLASIGTYTEVCNRTIAAGISRPPIAKRSAAVWKYLTESSSEKLQDLDRNKTVPHFASDSDFFGVGKGHLTWVLPLCGIQLLIAAILRLTLLRSVRVPWSNTTPERSMLLAFVTIVGFGLTTFAWIPSLFSAAPATYESGPYVNVSPGLFDGVLARLALCLINGIGGYLFIRLAIWLWTRCDREEPVLRTERKALGSLRRTNRTTRPSRLKGLSYLRSRPVASNTPLRDQVLPVAELLQSPRKEMPSDSTSSNAAVEHVDLGNGSTLIVTTKAGSKPIYAIENRKRYREERIDLEGATMGNDAMSAWAEDREAVRKSRIQKRLVVDISRPPNIAPGVVDLALTLDEYEDEDEKRASWLRERRERLNADGRDNRSTRRRTYRWLQ